MLINEKKRMKKQNQKNKSKDKTSEAKKEFLFDRGMNGSLLIFIFREDHSGFVTLFFFSFFPGFSYLVICHMTCKEKKQSHICSSLVNARQTSREILKNL